MDNSFFLVIDSGIGGLNVLKKLVLSGINENFSYLSDSSNAPYGTKSKEFLLNRVQYLMQTYGKGAKGVIFACNTLSTQCIADLQKASDLKFFGVYPDKPQGKTLVLCTRGTANSEYVKKLSALSEVTVFSPKGLVENIEKNIFGILDGDYGDIENSLPDGDGYDTVILGCTHYIFLTDLVKSRYKNAVVLDGTQAFLNTFVTRNEKCWGFLTQNNHEQNRAQIEFLGEDSWKNSRIFQKMLKQVF